VESPISICLAVEDVLSEAMLCAILRQSGRDYAVGNCYRRGGFGYLKKTIRGFNQAAKGVPFFVLADLDKRLCPPQMIADWLRVPRHPNLLFRIAVREVEAWVLADRKAFGEFFGVANRHVPSPTDQLPDPKRFLIDLVAASRNRELREAIVPARRSTAKQGPDYNRPLTEFVEKRWKLNRAVKHSTSLKRTLEVLQRFRPSPP
jgi:hypothetical protein